MNDINWIELLQPLMMALITTLIGYVASAIKLQIDKIKNQKIKNHLNIINETIAQTVAFTTQTFTNELKENDKFDDDAMKIAFDKTLKATKKMMASSTRDIITSIYGDVDMYLKSKIEQEIFEQKRQLKEL